MEKFSWSKFLSIVQKSPAFGFGSSKRSKGLNKDNIGPGSYEMRSSFDKALQKREFKQTSRRSFLNDRKEGSPGPGNYSPSKTFSKLSAPKYGFGTEK